MAIRVESAQGRDALAEFSGFFDRVYAGRAARWPAFVPFELAVLSSDSPYLSGRTIRPLVARHGAEIVARAIAIIDERYQRHWHERLGHIVMFEAMPDSHAATRLLLDTACEWLAENGADAARAGYGMFDLPFVIDDYESLPPTILRQNPPYYHRLLKEAGFETESGWVDYSIEARPDLVERWQNAVETAESAGFDIVRLRDCPSGARARDIARTWNDAFAGHWGHSPVTAGEFSFLIDALEATGVLDTTVIAYRGAQPMGVVWAIPESSVTARLAPGRTLTNSERLNVLAIGVRESARGTGLNLAMAGRAYLELVRRGATFMSYTLVLDDNWPSRRTAEKLGARTRANYVTYRRRLHR